VALRRRAAFSRKSDILTPPPSKKGPDVAHRPRRLLAGALTLAAVAALPACGGDKKPGAAPTPATTTPSGSATAPAPSTTATGPSATGPAGTATAPTGSGTPAPGTSAPATSPGATATPGTIKVTLALGDACVEPGGIQRATVTTVPGARVVVDTLYADKKDGQTHGGIVTDGKTDAKGRWTYAWTVKVGTPPGRAYTRAAAGKDNTRGSDTKSFDVAVHCP
jgi:hypothetical protein